MSIKKFDITPHEWDLVDTLTEVAKMDWFLKSTTKKVGDGQYEIKGYLNKEQVESSSCAFIAENFWKFSDCELQELRAFYIKCGIPAEDLDYELGRYASMRDDNNG